MIQETKMAWNLHRNSKSYTGAYPEGFLRNLNNLIGLKNKKVLHLFGGITKSSIDNYTNDIKPEIQATFHFDARKQFPIENDVYDVVLCDPPYDLEENYIHLSDKKKRLHYGKNLYNTEFVPLYSFIKETIRVCKPEGFICILHFLVYKQFPGIKRFALIPIISGHNLRIRILNIFQKLTKEQNLQNPKNFKYKKLI